MRRARVPGPVYLVLGWISVSLGVIGIFLPIMPTTVFMILAAFFFGRGSPRARAWLIGHPVFGPSIIRWEETGAIPRVAKFWSCVAMAASLGLTLWLQVPTWVLLLQLVALSGAAAFILSRPS
ncbi:YbaN family protein [Frigidibacter sp. ROC022]|uniref:YbaN family protein n=1 Tax=Frigidibacter sp. ROC022 TaxID=2971796 RepID=UPI00215AA2B5|nr:YbaN family protein [Frigidibacter sp. ROC022]MCR8725287.1 YbaN family protein [Frigidibacter sp. ROC022]